MGGISGEALLFVIAIIVGFAWVFIGLWAMNSLVVYSNVNQIPIFGRRYSDALHLHADMSFHWQLLVGTALASVGDVGLLVLLRRVRTLVIVGFSIGAVFILALTAMQIRGGSA